MGLELPSYLQPRRSFKRWSGGIERQSGLFTQRDRTQRDEIGSLTPLLRRHLRHLDQVNRVTMTKYTPTATHTGKDEAHPIMLVNEDDTDHGICITMMIHPDHHHPEICRTTLTSSKRTSGLHIQN